MCEINLEELKKEIPEIFIKVKKDVRRVVDRQRDGLRLGLAELGMYQGGFIGGMHFALGTDIVINKTPLRLLIELQPYEIVWAYIYHILMDMYINSLGVLIEQQRREITLRITENVFKEENHPAVILARNGIGSFFPNLKLNFATPDMHPDGIPVDYIYNDYSYENYGDNKISLEKVIKDLEDRFDDLRVYGDERDFEIFEPRNNPESSNCNIPIRASFLYPELKDDPKNKILISPECVEESLAVLVKYKFKNWTEVVSYDRIENRDTEPFDLSNSCVVPISTYTFLINLRRTNPSKAEEWALKIKRNIRIIDDYKYGKITEQQFQHKKSKVESEINQERNPFRSMARLKKDSDLTLDHIEKYIGKIGKSLHDQQFDQAPFSVHIIPKTHDGNFSVLATTGLSHLPMYPPQPMDFFKYSELIIKLPANWPLPKEHLTKNDFLWPFEQLLILMRYIHTNRQWFCDMHTYGNGNPPYPFVGNTGLCGFLFTFPLLSFPPEFCELRIDDTKSIIFLQLIPLYKEEMDYALTSGPDKLLKQFSENNIPDHVEIHRKNLFGSNDPLVNVSETAGEWCPYCNNVLREVSPMGTRCCQCKRLIVRGRDEKLLSLDISVEKPTVDGKEIEKAEKLFFEGIKYLKLLKNEKALVLLTKAVKVNPYEKRAWEVKLEILNKLGRYQEAEECAMEGLKYIFPKQEEKWANELDDKLIKEENDVK